MTNEPRPTLGDVLVERLARVMDVQPYVCPECDEQACVCWAYDDQGETMKDQPQAPEPSRDATVCPTCSGDGSPRRPFDGNCPATWAHKFTTLAYISEVNEPGIAKGRIVTLDKRIIVDEYDPTHPEVLWYCDTCETGHPVTVQFGGETVCATCLQNALNAIAHSLANPISFHEEAP